MSSTFDPDLINKLIDDHNRIKEEHEKKIWTFSVLIIFACICVVLLIFMLKWYFAKHLETKKRLSSI